MKADSDDTEVDEGEDGGDELDNNDTSDSEIEEEDKWQCQSCPERNHPMTRRCRRCWVVRQDWFATSLNRYDVIIVDFNNHVGTFRYSKINRHKLPASLYVQSLPCSECLHRI